jgi:hypothetical protein
MPAGEILYVGDRLDDDLLTAIKIGVEAERWWHLLAGDLGAGQPGPLPCW